MRDIQFVNSQTGWVAGDGGFIRKTTDGGNSWQFQFQGTNADYWYCPISGTLSVNNARIVFGSPIQVTVNGVTAYYTNCDALANASGGLCGY